MDQLQIHFDTGFVICKQCKFAVLPSHFDTHFSTKNHALIKSEREDLVESIRGTFELIEDITDIKPKISDFLNTKFDGNALPFLTLYYDGILCQNCLYICRNTKSIRNHCTTEHGWSNLRSKGNKKKNTQIDPWDCNIPCQRFFVSGYGSQYFKIISNPGRNLESITPINNGNDNLSKRGSSFVERETRISNVLGSYFLFSIKDSFL